MAWFTPGPRSPTVSRPARWISHTDGLVACPGSCRRYRTAPFRLAHVRPPAPARSGSLPGAPRLQGGGGTQACGSAGRRRRVAVLCLTVGPASRTGRRRVDAHRRADRHERADPPDCRRRAGGAVLPCRRETARGPAHVDNPGVLPLRSSRAGQGAGQRGQAAIGRASAASWRISCCGCSPPGRVADDGWCRQMMVSAQRRGAANDRGSDGRHPRTDNAVKPPCGTGTHAAAHRRRNFPCAAGSDGLALAHSARPGRWRACPSSRRWNG